MKKRGLLLVIMASIITLAGCQMTPQTPQPQLSDYEKIVEHIKSNSTENVLLIEGTDPKPLDDVKIELVGNFIRLHLGDGNYVPQKNEISVMMELDLKKDTSVYNYEADYWYNSGSGYRMYGVEGIVNATTFDGNALTYETHGLDRPTTTTMQVFASKMYYMISTARGYLLETINVDIAIEFGFDEFL